MLSLTSVDDNHTDAPNMVTFGSCYQIDANLYILVRYLISTQESSGDGSTSIIIEGPEETVSDIRSEFNTIPNSACNILERRNLDGSPATWMAIATLSLQALPHILNFIASRQRPKLPTKIKVGNIEIENPTEEDLDRLRKLYTTV
jgi:hypothetical protein